MAIKCGQSPGPTTVFSYHIRFFSVLVSLAPGATGGNSRTVSSGLRQGKTEATRWTIVVITVLSFREASRAALFL